MPGRGRKTPVEIKLYYLIAALIYTFDQVSKYFIERYLSVGESVPVLKGVFHLTLVHNTGAAFGIFKGHPYFFVFAAIIFAGAAAYFLKKKSSFLTSLEKVAISLLLGGTLGNLTDRLRFGFVVDFLDFRVWPVFNLADSSITIGAVILAFSIISEVRKKKCSE